MNYRSYCTKYYLFSDKKQLGTLNNIRVLLKGVLIDLHAHNFMHGKTFLHACCMHTRHHACNLSSPAIAHLNKYWQAHASAITWHSLTGLIIGLTLFEKQSIVRRHRQNSYKISEKLNYLTKINLSKLLSRKP